MGSKKVKFSYLLNLINRKIKNANPKLYNGTEFKSLLELVAYKTLCEQGYSPEYESYSYIIWEGFKPTIPFYNKDKKTDNLKIENKKIIDIKYTPDFTFFSKDKSIFVIMEVKGFENDVFYIKKKLFRRYLESMQKDFPYKLMYFEVYNKKHVIQALDIIENYGKYCYDKKIDSCP